MDANQLGWMFQLSVKQAQGEALRALMTEMVDATRANEPGTLDYEWYLSEDGERLHLYERYDSSAAALTHLAVFGERYMRRFFDVLTPERMVVYGAPNDAVREALAGLGPSVMQHAAGFSRRGAQGTA